MRDLTEHPITLTEVIQTLKELRDISLKRELIGNMRPAILQEAINLLRYPSSE